MKHVLAAVALGMGLTLSLHALPAGAKRTDQSDLWWIRAESGWGIHRRAGNDGFRDDVRIRPERPADVVHRSDGGAPGSLIGREHFTRRRAPGSGPSVSIPVRSA